MNIPIKMNKDFEKAIASLNEKYGEDFEILNGFHESQLNFSDFIDGFIDKNVADVTIDANANASNKDIRSLLNEKGKSLDKLFAFNKIFYEIKKRYGLRTAKEWLETEYNGGFYLHDASSSTYLPYCFSGDTEIITDRGVKRLDELVGEDIKVINMNREWENATVKSFGKNHLRRLTIERNSVTREIFATPNHVWFVCDEGNEIMRELTTDELNAGMYIPFVRAENSVDPSASPDREDDRSWRVVSVERTERYEETYCAVVDGTQSFTLDGNVLTHNCYAYDLTRLATEGLFFLKNYNNQAPKHLTTFMDDVIEYISYMSNRSSGAVGIANILIWTYYFWKKDCETGHVIKNNDYYIRQCFQKFIYRLNQPFMRIRS